VKKRRKLRYLSRSPVHPQDEIDNYEAILLEQTRARPGSWVDEEFREHAIRWLADKARKAPPGKSGVPKRQAVRQQRQAQERQQKWEREAYYTLLRAEYFVKVVSLSARGLPLQEKKSTTSKELIDEAAKKFGMRSRDITYEVNISSFYNAINDKWKAWVASIAAPQTRFLWADVDVRGTLWAKAIGISCYRTPEWTVDDATERAAKVAVRLITRATAGVKWPKAEVRQLFAEFSEETVRQHFENLFAPIIRRERGRAAKQISSRKNHRQ
jgi:hypothetical protein